MGIYSSKSIRTTDNTINPPSNIKYDLPKQKIDEDHHTAAHYFIKHITDPNISYQIRTILFNEVLMKNPTLREALNLINKTRQISSNAETDQKKAQHLADNQRKHKTKMEELKAKQEQLLARLRTNVEQASDIQTATQQQITKFKAARLQITKQSQPVKAPATPYPSPATTDDEATTESA